MIVIIGIFGVGMSLPGDTARYFFTNLAQQLFLTGRFSEDPLVLPYILGGFAVTAASTLVACIVWTWRMRSLR